MSIVSLWVETPEGTYLPMIIQANDWPSPIIKRPMTSRMPLPLATRRSACGAEILRREAKTRLRFGMMSAKRTILTAGRTETRMLTFNAALDQNIGCIDRQ